MDAVDIGLIDYIVIVVVVELPAVVLVLLLVEFHHFGEFAVINLMDVTVVILLFVLVLMLVLALMIVLGWFTSKRIPLVLYQYYYSCLYV